RILRLTEHGPEALRALAAGRATEAQRRLGRRLVDAGLAHPRPGPAARGATVIVPVKDRAEALDRCLGGLAKPDAAEVVAGGGTHVVVVDDSSSDRRVARVARRHGARVVRRE